MKIPNPLLRGAASLLVSGVISLVLFVLFGAIIPVFAMIAIFGIKNVQDAPGHGGLILFLTLPIAGVLSLTALFLLTLFFYKKFAPVAGKPGSASGDAEPGPSAAG